MKTTANGTTAAQVNNNRENMNAANMGASYNKIDDFGAKIGGARKDLYQAAREWAEKLADITAEALTKAGGVSKLVRLPNLESMTAAGAITGPTDGQSAPAPAWRLPPPSSRAQSPQPTTWPTSSRPPARVQNLQ